MCIHSSMMTAAALIGYITRNPCKKTSVWPELNGSNFALTLLECNSVDQVVVLMCETELILQFGHIFFSTVNFLSTASEFLTSTSVWIYRTQANSGRKRLLYAQHETALRL